MLHGKQISVQLSTGTGYTGPKSPTERSRLSSKDMEKEKSRKSTEHKSQESARKTSRKNRDPSLLLQIKNWV